MPLRLVVAACFVLLLSATPVSAQETHGSFEIVERPTPESTYLAYRDTVAFDAMESFYATHLAAVYANLVRAGLEPGPATGLYWTWDEAAGKTDMAAAVSFSGPAPANLPDGYRIITLPAGTAVGVDYRGPYDGLGGVHEAIGAQLGDRMHAAAVAVEEYITDPQSEPDSSQWLTRVFYLIPELE